MKTSVLTIKGMGCAGCATTVEQSISRLKGVEATEVNLDSATAKVTFAEGSVNEKDFEQAVSNAGYLVTNIK